MQNFRVRLLTLTMIGIGCISSSAYADIFDGSPHQLLAKHSNKCMDLRNPKTVDSAAVVQMQCNNDIFQTWKTIAVGNNEYQIVSAGSKMCLDVSGASKQNGAPIKQSSCVNQRSNQTWTIKQVLANMYQIISKNSQKCLYIPNASKRDDIQLQQWDCAAISNQLWQAQPLLKPSPPIVLDNKSDVVISNVKISNPAGPCISVIGNSKNIIIKDSELGPCNTNYQSPRPDLSNVGAGVFVNSSTNITLSNLTIHDTEDSGITIFYGSNYKVNDNQISKTLGNAIKAQSLSDITIQNNSIDSVRSGIYVSGSSNVKVLKNNLSHMQGTPRANFVQFNQVNGAGNRIMCNIGFQDAYGTTGSQDSTEDNISVYSSNGTPTDPILVVGNKVKNGGPSRTGSGIMLGDNGGSNIIARDNVTVNTGNLGIAVSGGTNIQVLNNKLFSVTLPITNNALAAWNYNVGKVICDNATVSGNQVNWTNQWGPESKVWANNTCTNSRFDGNKFNDSTLSESIFDTYISSECK
jgi:parallel beta-helix repeat protein